MSRPRNLKKCFQSKGLDTRCSNGSAYYEFGFPRRQSRSCFPKLEAEESCFVSKFLLM